MSLALQLGGCLGLQWRHLWTLHLDLHWMWKSANCAKLWSDWQLSVAPPSFVLNVNSCDMQQEQEGKAGQSSISSQKEKKSTHAWRLVGLAYLGRLTGVQFWQQQQKEGPTDKILHCFIELPCRYFWVLKLFTHWVLRCWRREEEWEGIRECVNKSEKILTPSLKSESWFWSVMIIPDFEKVEGKASVSRDTPWAVCLCHIATPTLTSLKMMMMTLMMAIVKMLSHSSYNQI